MDLYVVYNTATASNAYFSTRKLAEDFINSFNGKPDFAPGQLVIYSHSVNTGQWE